MSWDDEAATWDDNPAVRAYADAAHASLRRLLAASGTTIEGRRVLDFGCGTGLLTTELAREADEVVGLDLSPRMIDVLAAKQIPNVRALTGTLDSHPLGSFDLITCSSVLAFVDDYPATLAALAARLRPDGRLVQWDWELDDTDDEPYGLTREQMRSALNAAGLAQVQVQVAFEKVFEGHTMAPLLGTGVRADG